MTTFLATFIAVAVIVALMAIGVVFGRPTIKGSCGGVGGSGCLCAQGKKGCDDGSRALNQQKPE